MELVLATRNLAAPGGSETYALTVAEHLARLGHGVWLLARNVGDVAAAARATGLRVTDRLEALPHEVHAVITQIDGGLAIELAARYPTAVRIFVVHGSDDVYLPRPAPGVVTATVALNDRLMARAAASAGAGEVVRMRQPVDLRRFSPRGVPPRRPKRVLLLGNYHSGPRVDLLRETWTEKGLEFRSVGGGSQSLAVGPEIAQADVVVGYGRSIIEAMASGRPAYVHDHAGSDGWVTPQSYAALEADGFSGTAGLRVPDARELRADLEHYTPDLGRSGQDLARTHHDARDHAAQLVALIDRLAAEPPGDYSGCRALELIAEAQWRAEALAETHRMEAKGWFERSQALERESVRLAEELRESMAWIDRLNSTRRWRAVQALLAPLDRMRGRRG